MPLSSSSLYLSSSCHQQTKETNTAIIPILARAARIPQRLPHAIFFLPTRTSMLPYKFPNNDSHGHSHLLSKPSLYPSLPAHA